jgi:serine/threonine protein kinase
MQDTVNILLIVAAIYVVLGICLAILIRIWRNKSGRKKQASGGSRQTAVSKSDNANVVNGRYEMKTPPYKQGGMSTIWLATDRKTGRTCIIKTPRRGTSIDNIYLDKLVQEARFLEKLQHPGIVKYLDDFYYKDEFHLVLEYLDGETLLASSQRSPVEEQRVIFWASHVLDALSYIHGKGIIHRDINPKNIMLCSDGTAKLIDFGTAKNLNNSKNNKANRDPFTQITNRGFDIPELMSGESDHRCDLCGLAQTCIYLLTLKHPNEICTGLFKYSWPRSYKEAREVADYLIAAGISSRTAKLLAQGIMYSADNRFADARAMQAALSAIDGYEIRQAEVLARK